MKRIGYMIAYLRIENLETLCAKIILLKDDGYTVPEIRKATNHHDSNIRKWIHRFNEKGIDGIASKIHKHKPIKISDDMENKIVEIATKSSRKDYGLPFSTWSLRGTSRICLQGDEPCRCYQPHRG